MFICKDFCPCSFVIQLQRATVLPCIKLFNMFTKDRGPCSPVYLQRVLMVRTLKSLVYFQFVSTSFLSPAFGVAKIFVIKIFENLEGEFSLGRFFL